MAGWIKSSILIKYGDGSATLNAIKQLKTGMDLSPDEEKELKKLKKGLKNLRAFHKWLWSTPCNEVTDSLEMLSIESSHLFSIRLDISDGSFPTSKFYCHLVI